MKTYLWDFETTVEGVHAKDVSKVYDTVVSYFPVFVQWREAKPRNDFRDGIQRLFTEPVSEQAYLSVLYFNINW